MYKSLKSLDEAGNLYSECYHSRTLLETYKCCMKLCSKDKICPATCKNIYMGTILDSCTNKDCCLRKCKASKWSSSKSILKSIPPALQVDCDDYCGNIEIYKKLKE